jgi:hypothetical protein
MAQQDDPEGHEEQRGGEDAIRAFVERISRPGPDGRRVVERAAIMAEGSTAAAILDWLAAESWVPEDEPEAAAQGSGSGMSGMHRERQSVRAGARAPRRYVSPPPDAG